MNLRLQAEIDLRAIIGDTATGFGWAVTVTDPSETSVPLTALSNDISAVIDPDTGLVVSGREASVSIPIADLTAAGLGLPIGVADTASKPWLVGFDDINGNSYTFKVKSTLPDRAIGAIVCLLEEYSA